MLAIKKRPEQARSEAITKLFKIALFNKGWTQEHLAKVANYDKAKVNRIINRPLQYDLLDLLCISDKLGVRLLSDDIYGK